MYTNPVSDPFFEGVWPAVGSFTLNGLARFPDPSTGGVWPAIGSFTLSGLARFLDPSSEVFGPL
jgi:hypothetical protein